MYIRTKDGVYEVKVNKYHELVYCKNNQIVLSCNIIKQADTKEELCDEFVVVGKEHLIWHTLTFDQIKLAFANENYEIYGAIWTSKGLIYVAKMNENGELELV